MSLTLYSHADDPRVNKIQVAAAYAGVEINLAENFDFPKDLSSPEFLEKNPIGKVPVLETEDGCIFETNAILRFVGRISNNNLYGSNDVQRSQIDAWIDFSKGEVELPAASLLYPIWDLVDEDEDVTAKAQDDIDALMTSLEAFLLKKTYLVGERLSLADIAVAFSLYALFVEYFNPGLRNKFGSVFRWFDTVVHQPHFLTNVGKIAYAKKNAGPKAKKGGNKGGSKKGKKGAKKPQQQKKKPAKPSVDYLGKHPQTGTFGLESWKRTYQNEESEAATNWLWTNFDLTGYSMFIFSYDDPSRCTVNFVTSNKIGGFFQRCDAVKGLHNHSMAQAVILENADGKFQIAGVWIFRGLEVPQIFKDTLDDTNYYTWTKVDPTNEEQKQLVNDIFSQKGEFNGLGEYYDQRGFGC